MTTRKKTTRRAKKKPAKKATAKRKAKATVSLRSPLGARPVEPVAVEPEPVAAEPEPIAVEPEPAAPEPEVIPFPEPSPPVTSPSGWVTVVYEGEDVFFHREAGVFVKGTQTSLRAGLAEQLRHQRGFRLAG